MHITILLAALAIEAGRMVAKTGLQMILPEIAKIMDNEEAAKSLPRPDELINRAIDGYRKMRLRSR